MWKLQSRLSPDSSNNPFVFSKPTCRSCQWFIASRLGRVVPLKAGCSQDWLPHKRQGKAYATYMALDLLRFTTAGSVDDGKSTLIGRLLYDSQAVYEDQLASVRKRNGNRSTGPMDFSLRTDGL